MDLNQIKAKVKEHIDQALGGQSMEDPKFDFKLKWPNLKEKPGLNEFLKDITAIANTFGPDGFLVYGFQDRDRTFQDAVFSDCGLRDESDLFDLQAKHLSNNFDLNEYDVTIDGHKLSVLHIPPTLSKPIVIKNYVKFKDKEKFTEFPQKIFVRKGTTTQTASKNDLELMYYDRKNVIPEYDCQISIMQFAPVSIGGVVLIYEITIENLGRRSICIRSIVFKLSFGEVESVFGSNNFTTIDGQNRLLFSSLIIRPNEIQYFKDQVTLGGGSSAISMEEIAKQIEEGGKINVVLRLTNGKSLTFKSEVLFR